MKSEKQYFLDRRFVLFFLSTAFLITMTVLAFFGSVVIGIVFSILTVASVFAALFTPVGFVMDDRGVHIRYALPVKQTVPWDKVERVTLCYDDAASRGGLHLPYLLETFAFHGEFEGGSRFFMSTKIPRTSRARRAIERHMAERIADFEIVDVRKPEKPKL